MKNIMDVVFFFAIPLFLVIVIILNTKCYVYNIFIIFFLQQIFYCKLLMSLI